MLLASVLLLVAGVATARADWADVDAASVEAAPAGIYDFTNHGTAWVAQKRDKFSVFQPLSLGTRTKLNAAGRQWVHIPIPFPSRVADTLMNVKYVEFCAQSSDGASTKPLRMVLSDYLGEFLTTAVSWPADNAKHCFGYEFTTTVFHQDLGVSVLLKFGSTDDSITLYKAWARVVP